MTEQAATSNVPPGQDHSEAVSGEIPRGIDTSVPNVARIYDHLLGGKDNFASDRRAAHELAQLVPEAAQVAADNRGFLRRAVKFLAAEAGIRQFIDIGTGLPTRGNVHQIAQRWRTGSRILYVDNDPVVVAHAQALLADNSTAIAVNRDLRDPGSLLDHPALQALMDFSEPIAVLLVAILHFIGNDESPHEIVSEIMASMPSGSYLVISHGTADDVDAGIRQKVRRLYDRSATVSARSHAEIMRFFDGCQVIEPGIVAASAWRNGFVTSGTGRVLCYAGVGVKR